MSILLSKWGHVFTKRVLCDLNEYMNDLNEDIYDLNEDMYDLNEDYVT